jgi:hypothetical protein
MTANIIDAEIRKYVSLMGSEDKKSLLNMIKNILHLDTVSKDKNSKQKSPLVDYTKYRFPVSQIKFNRDEINER